MTRRTDSLRAAQRASRAVSNHQPQASTNAAAQNQQEAEHQITQAQEEEDPFAAMNDDQQSAESSGDDYIEPRASKASGSGREPKRARTQSELVYTREATPDQELIFEMLKDQGPKVDHLSILSNELLVSVFMNLEYGDLQPFTATSKRFHALEKDSWLIANYFLCTFGKKEALFRVLCHPSLATVPVLKFMLKGGARLSRYLLQMITRSWPIRTKIPEVRLSSNLFARILNVPSQCLSANYK